MKDLRKLFEECEEELDAIGIKYGFVERVKINTRAKNRWGQCACTLYSTIWENCIYEIEISDRLLQDNISDIATKQTIVHELLHSCEDCMCHTGEWKRLADKVNKAYPCYHISRTTSAEELGVTEKIVPRYVLKCTQCGHEYEHYRMSKAIKHPELFLCGKCHGTLNRIK